VMAKNSGEWLVLVVSMRETEMIFCCMVVPLLWFCDE
jgi:hypothetical protein